MEITKNDMMRRILKHYYDKEYTEFLNGPEYDADYPAFDFWIEQKFKIITGL